MTTYLARLTAPAREVLLRAGWTALPYAEDRHGTIWEVSHRQTTPLPRSVHCAALADGVLGIRRIDEPPYPTEQRRAR